MNFTHFFDSTTGDVEVTAICFTARQCTHGRQLFAWASASTQIATTLRPCGLRPKRSRVGGWCVRFRGSNRSIFLYVSASWLQNFSQLAHKIMRHHRSIQHSHSEKCLLENCASEVMSLVRAIVENWSRQDTITIYNYYCSLSSMVVSSSPKRWDR